MIEKVLSLTLVLSMLMSMMSITAFADNTGSGAIIGADGGYFAEIDFRLFDYSGDSNTNDQIDEGVNSNGVADFFKFRGSHKENSAESSALLPQNPIWDDDGYTADRVQLLPYLDEDGYPLVDLSRAEELAEAFALIATPEEEIAAAQAVLNHSDADVAEKAAAQAKLDEITAAENLIRKYETDSRYSAYFSRDTYSKITVPDEVSLAFLFDPDSTARGVTAYDPQNTILRYDPTTKTYSYDSAQNAVDYIEGENRFYVRDYTERTSTSNTSYEHDGNDFLPFNYTANGVRGGGTGKNGAYVYLSADDAASGAAAEVNYWFGMTMEFDFWMPEDGKIDGQDMKFEFSGDDDVWVFIDDQLVMDLGGTHGTVTGSINFATGEVKQYLDWIGSTESDDQDEYDEDGKLTKEQTSFATSFSELGVSVAEKEKHTLKFFYLERAVAVANCSMKFNMPVIPAGLVSVTKEVTGDVNGVYADQEYVFALYDKDGNVQKKVPYTIGDPTNTEVKYTDEETGYFTLKAGETAYFASFSSDHVGDYYFEEIDVPGFTVVSSQVNGGRSMAGEVTGLFHISPAGANSIVFTNAMKTGSFRFTKVNTANEPLAGAEFTLTSDNFTATEESDAQGVVAFTNIPYGTYTLRETNAPEGYEINDALWTVTVAYNGGVKVALNEYEADADGYLATVPQLPVSGESGVEEPVYFTVTNARLNSLTITKDVAVTGIDEAGSNVHADILEEKELAGTAYSFTVVGWKNDSEVYRNENVIVPVAADNDGVVVSGSVTLSGLPSGTYTISENMADEQYVYEHGGAVYEIDVDYDKNAVTLNDGGSDTVAVTNTYIYIPETVELKVVKDWQDGNDQDGIRPESIRVQLYADDQPSGESVLLDAVNSWEHTFRNLDKFRNGSEIVYTVVEVEIPDGYTADAPVKNGTTYIITNRHTPAQTSVSGVKNWDDENDADGKRPDSITVTLLANGTKVDEQTVTADNGWAYRFAGLDKYSAGTLINYSVKEVLPVGSEYSASYSGYNITNTYTPGKTTYSVIKAWDDANDQDGIRPESINVQLYADGVAYGEAVTLGEGNHWSYTWEGLNINQSGEPIVYSVQEVNVPEGYTVAEAVLEGNVFTLTNSHTPDMTSVTVNKVWDGGSAQSRKQDVTMYLFADGEKIETVVLNEDNGWTHTWDGLPKNKAGNLIAYTVDEEALGGYWSKNISHDGNIWTVSNRYYQPSYDSVRVVKVWDDDGNEAGLRPESIRVQLLDDGAPYGVPVVLKASTGWDHTWNRLPEGGTWSVAELDVPDGYTCSVSGNGSVFTITNSVSTEPIPHTPDPLSDMGEDEPPLANVPATGDFSALWAAMSVLSGSGLAVMRLCGRKKREDEE